MEVNVPPFFGGVWRSHPQGKALQRVRLLNSREFFGFYGQIVLRWNLIVGFVKPRSSTKFFPWGGQ